MTLYHLAHSIAFSTLSDYSGPSISLAERVFVLIQKIVRHMYDMYLVLPESADTWKLEVIELVKYYGSLGNLG